MHNIIEEREIYFMWKEQYDIYGYNSLFCGISFKNELNRKRWKAFLNLNFKIMANQDKYRLKLICKILIYEWKYLHCNYHNTT